MRSWEQLTVVRQLAATVYCLNLLFARFCFKLPFCHIHLFSFISNLDWRFLLARTFYINKDVLWASGNLHPFFWPNSTILFPSDSHTWFEQQQKKSCRHISSSSKSYANSRSNCPWFLIASISDIPAMKVGLQKVFYFQLKIMLLHLYGVKSRPDPCCLTQVENFYSRVQSGQMNNKIPHCYLER